MIEGIEKLRELEDVFGEISGFGRGDALIYNVRRLRRCEPEFPNVIRAGAVQKLSVFSGGKSCSQTVDKGINIDLPFSEYVGRSCHCVLRIRSGFAHEA